MSPPSRAPSIATAAAPSPAEEIAEARRLGRLEAERFDDELRRREEGDIAVVREHLAGEAVAQVAIGSVDSSRLRRQVEDLASFHGAVMRSRGWRLLQLLRRPFGRAW
ncbi:MAG TPA: hypothetical protein VGV61_08920 [Thermoanaerobaculia bacterium]|nr:hypothetical protein [Thermoanaerobaculia bacterium]